MQNSTNSSIASAVLVKQYAFKKANSAEEYNAIYQSRLEQYKTNYQYLLNYTNQFPAKDKYDEHSTLFYATNHKEIIASARITPCMDGCWEISEHLPPDFKLGIDPLTTIQLSRLYVKDEFRNNGLHEFMFYHFSEWIINNSPYTQYFAVCKKGQVRIYQKLGAELGVSVGFNLVGRSNDLYYLVVGNIHKFNSIIKTKYLKDYGNTY